MYPPILGGYFLHILHDSNHRMGRSSRKEDIFLDNSRKDRFQLLPKDYRSLYCYWEISDSRRNMIEEFFRCNWEALPKIIRVYDVSFIDFNGDNAHYHWDFPINDIANNWFIDDVHANCSYCLDYGTTTIDGRFFTILRSNTVKTPPKEANYWRETRIEKMDSELNSEPEWLKRFTGYTITN